MATNNTPVASVGMVSIDAPDAAVLAHFYARLLDLEVKHEGEGYAMIGREGTTSLGFGTDPSFIPPSWPDDGHKQFHLDIAATDPSATVAAALELARHGPSTSRAASGGRCCSTRPATRSA